MDDVTVGFCLNVNTVLWNTIRMLFPKTNEAPASPPTPSPIRRATDRQLRQLLTAEAELLRRMETDRSVFEPTTHAHWYDTSAIARASRESYPNSHIRMNAGWEAQSNRRRRRMSATVQGMHLHRWPTLGVMASLCVVGCRS